MVEMGLLDWARLLLGMVLFLGPGYCISTFLPNYSVFDRTKTVLLSFVFTVSFWAALFAWLQPAGVRLSAAPVVALTLLGWLIGIFRQYRAKKFHFPSFRWRDSAARLLLWLLLASIAAAGLWTVRGRVVAPGSDSYHHSLIPQLIMEQGRLLENYQPVTDQIVTFTYHFGFHITVAVLGWLSGVQTYQIVMILGVLWIALSALSTAFLTESFTGSRWGGLAAAAVTGVVCVFPAAMLNWGRFPQVEGLIFLTVFIGLIREQPGPAWNWRRAAIFGLLAAGLGFTHYRAALMTIASVAALLIALWVEGSLRQIQNLKSRIFEFLGIGAAAAVFFAPWALHTILARQQGYALIVSTFDPMYFSLSRLGPGILGYPTNTILFVLAGAAVLWGVLLRSQAVLWAVIWTGIALVFSHPSLASTFMDRISTIISLYIPLSVAIGWLAAELIKRRAGIPKWGKIGLAALSVGIVLWSFPKLVGNIREGAPYVQQDDLPAFRWIRENTPSSAYFMVSLFHFPFSPDLIISLDAGYWLPLFTGRRSVSIPMSYMSEKFRSPEGINTLKALDQLEGKLCTPEAVQLLSKEGVTHVFIGSIDERISAQELAGCPNYSLEFNYKDTYVFRFEP